MEEERGTQAEQNQGETRTNFPRLSYDALYSTGPDQVRKWNPQAPGTHMMYRHTCRQNTLHIKNFTVTNPHHF